MNEMQEEQTKRECEALKVLIHDAEAHGKSVFDYD